ncbi:Proteasome activator complex subunit 3 [Operophtera brumata]|uniref:Proteasome activator complex subunit 3 n=1 Tax=Operophtera brumata TaxID=104452 RepID=A0A0L7LP70_OPEBR|nr:Proteasome activator complex subunit 3 [Operophtera brumata]
MWVSFMIPKFEDGNNFGVSIHEHTLAQIRLVELDTRAFFDEITVYFMARADAVSKVAMFPHIEDYRRVVRELDEKAYREMRLIITELRDRCCALHAHVIENLEKIKMPRSVNASASLY